MLALPQFNTPSRNELDNRVSCLPSKLEHRWEVVLPAIQTHQTLRITIPGSLSYKLCECKIDSGCCKRRSPAGKRKLRGSSWLPLLLTNSTLPLRRFPYSLATLPHSIDWPGRVFSVVAIGPRWFRLSPYASSPRAKTSASVPSFVVEVALFSHTQA